MLNRLEAIGNLGRDVEMSYTQGGRAVSKFSLAVTRRWTDTTTGEKKEATTWFNCVAWGPLAETCNTYLRKGAKVYVAGRMESREYTDKDNVKRVAWDLTLSDMEMLDTKPREGAGAAPGTLTADADANDGIPF